VQWQEQPDALGARVAVDEQVGGLADPVLDGGPGQLDPGRPVVQGQEGGGRVAVGREAGGQAEQTSSSAVRSLGVGLLDGAGEPVTVTALAPW
jgi:hypothetical protein